MKNAKFSWHDPQYKSAGTRQSSPIPLRAYLDTATSRGQKEHGAGTPRELGAGTAALRSAGVLACEFWQRPAASLVARCTLSVPRFFCAFVLLASGVLGCQRVGSAVRKDDLTTTVIPSTFKGFKAGDEREVSGIKL